MDGAERRTEDGTGRSATATSSAERGPFTGAFVLAYLLGALLIGTLVWAGGLWDLLANTRILDLLMRSGVVALTDADPGLYRGVPDTEYFIASQDPIDWGLIALVVALLLLALGLRGLRLHRLVRFGGVERASKDDVRVSMYAWASGRFLPYGYERAATVSGLAGEGVPRERAAQAEGMSRIFLGSELAVFAIVGLLAVAWSTALGMLVWPLVIGAVGWYMGRSGSAESRAVSSTWRRGAMAALAQRPSFTVGTAAVSWAAFLLEVGAVYGLSRAFSSTHVILNISFPVIMLGLVGAYLAGLVQITPGGVGQFEWGFAAALYAAGAGVPGITIPVLYMIVRYLLAGVVLLGIRLGRGVATRPALILEELSSPEAEPA